MDDFIAWIRAAGAAFRVTSFVCFCTKSMCMIDVCGIHLHDDKNIVL